MASPKSKRRVRRVIALLDIILTVALIVQIIICIIIPLLQEKEASRYKSGMGTPNPHQDGQLIEKWWMWAFLVICVVVAFVPIVAAVSLFMSTFSNIESERTMELTRFWMYCNSITLIVVVIWFLGVFLLDLLVVNVGFPLPTLIYFCIRALLTFFMWKQLNTMSPTSPANFNDDLLEEKRARYREISKLPTLDRQSFPEFCATVQPSDLPLPLQPYNNGGGGRHNGGALSMQNCQCCAVQNC